MKGSGKELLGLYHDIPEEGGEVDNAKAPRAEQAPIYDLRKFLETYVTSLPNLIKAFPRNNLDINALEAHTWDRLRYFYTYDSFKDVEIKKKEEIRFINKAISLMEEWFYGGEWTSCMTMPESEAIQEMVSHEKDTFLKRVRRVEHADLNPNLGRDAKRPTPNIYEDIESGKDPQEVYFNHAFKFFQGPAAILNTLTKIATQREIVSDRARFESFIRSVTPWAQQKFREWGYGQGPAFVEDGVKSLNGQREGFKQCRRMLFFMKTSLEGAEMMRRTRHPGLTRGDFEATIGWIGKSQEEQKNRHQSPDFLPFDFSPSGEFPGSMMHVNARELPLALLSVEYLRSNRRTG